MFLAAVVTECTALNKLDSDILLVHMCESKKKKEEGLHST